MSCAALSLRASDNRKLCRYQDNLNGSKRILTTVMVAKMLQEQEFFVFLSRIVAKLMAGRIHYSRDEKPTKNGRELMQKSEFDWKSTYLYKLP